jgi:alpha-tubulin suppressor-like RCC1 family protein
MGCPDELIQDPRPVPRPLSLCLERVKMVSCSARHTLVLTHLGLVYSCGDNTEGALGSGDVVPRHQLLVVSEWWTVPKQPADAGDRDRFILDESMVEHKVAERPPLIVQVAAGGGFIGSHSMAIDEDGNLYGWGVAQATGHGNIYISTVLFRHILYAYN